MKTENKDNTDTQTTYNAELTQDDLKALGKKGLRMDTGDDRLLQNRSERIDFTGKDLDVPKDGGNNLSSSSGPVDEENTLFGQGGERKENLETPERANKNNGSN